MMRICWRRIGYHIPVFAIVILGIIAGGAVSRPSTPALACDAGRDGFVSGKSPPPPRVYLLDGNALLAARENYLAGDTISTTEFTQLRSAAERALTDGPFSVTAKSSPQEDVDPHEYVSLAIYYWPNPSTADGLPYVRRDGHIDPEARNPSYDETSLVRMVNDVNLLATAYYILGDERYADRAALLLRTWFLDSDTRMSPDLNYSQIIPGLPPPAGGSGIIEGMPLLSIPDSSVLLAGSSAWTADDQSGLQDWFAQMLDWLQQSAPGMAQSRESDNHGSWYDAQVALYALFTEQPELAAQIIADAGPKRIATQIDPDGSQPLELARTRPFHYSVFNLDALAVLASLGSQVGVDLWSYQTEDGRSMQKALDFLLPFATGQEVWTYSDLDSVPPSYLIWVLNQAAAVYPQDSYRAALSSLFPPSTQLQALGLSVDEWLTDQRLTPASTISYSGAAG
jgi:Alginate lyase